jgi:hypothetical protein
VCVWGGVDLKCPNNNPSSIALWTLEAFGIGYGSFDTEWEACPLAFHSTVTTCARKIVLVEVKVRRHPPYYKLCVVIIALFALQPVHSHALRP